MLINQFYGLYIGLGTIDRMKLKDDDEVFNDSIPFQHVFGISWLSYVIPIDPVFENEDEVFRYRLGSKPYYLRDY